MNESPAIYFFTVAIACMFIFLCVFTICLTVIRLHSLELEAKNDFRSWSSGDLQRMGLYGRASPELGVFELCEKYGRLEYNCSGIKN